MELNSERVPFGSSAAFDSRGSAAFSIFTATISSDPDLVICYWRVPVLGSTDLVGEVEDGPAAAHPEGGAVIRPRRLQGGGVGPEPDPGPPTVGVPDLRRELPPGSLPDATVPPPDGLILRLG